MPTHDSEEPAASRHVGRDSVDVPAGSTLVLPPLEEGATMRGRILIRGVVAASALFGALCLPSAAGAATSQTGVQWLEAKIGTHGFISGPGNVPDLSSTVQTALALAAKGVTSDVATISYLEHHENAYVDGVSAPSASNDDAGKLAYLIILAHASSSEGGFGVRDLVARLIATQQPSGLFGTSDPTYDGTIRESLAINALVGEGFTSSDPVLTKALTWLKAQQCANGGFSSYAPGVSCAGSPANYLGPDTNSTGYAVGALAALQRPNANGTPLGRGLAFLAANERSWGWGFFPGNVVDDNSTAIVELGLRSAGVAVDDPKSPFGRQGLSASGLLRRFQVSASVPDGGGFRFQLNSIYPSPDQLSTEQSVLALSGKNFWF